MNDESNKGDAVGKVTACEESLAMSLLWTTRLAQHGVAAEWTREEQRTPHLHSLTKSRFGFACWTSQASEVSRDAQGFPTGAGMTAGKCERVSDASQFP